MSSLLKNLLSALCITLLLGVAYYFYSTSTGDELAQDAAFTSEIDLKTEKLLADTQRINTYDLDVSIFDDQRFISLYDFTKTIVDVRTGRLNPFEPVQ